MAKVTEQENNTINLIGAGTTIKGDVESAGDIRIDGNLRGNLRTKGKVVIGTTGLVKGAVNCRHSDVEGKIEGKIIVNELLSLKATSTILGDIAAKRLAIEPGAKFTGNCNMTSETISVDAEPAIVQEETKKPK
jgi:cytoskeletal protein CcmA (bactofilin family)